MCRYTYRLGQDDGRFVIAWTDTSPGEPDMVRARAFGSHGTRSGDEFRVEATPPEGNRSAPRVRFAVAPCGFSEIPISGYRHCDPVTREIFRLDLLRLASGRRRGAG